MSVMNSASVKELNYRENVGVCNQVMLDENNSNELFEIIRAYLESNPDIPEKVYTKFKSRYLLSKSETKGFSKEEVTGLVEVYNYINKYSFDNPCNFTIYELLSINSILFKHTPYPQYACRFRNSAAIILGSRIEVADYGDIPERLHELNYEFKQTIKRSHNLEEYIRRAVKLHAKLFNLLPFSAGNRRSILALFNLLMKHVELPPVFIEKQEKEKYYAALEIAITEGDTNVLEQFFMVKLANAVLEIDKEILN